MSDAEWADAWADARPTRDDAAEGAEVVSLGGTEETDAYLEAEDMSAGHGDDSTGVWAESARGGDGAAGAAPYGRAAASAKAGAAADETVGPAATAEPAAEPADPAGPADPASESVEKTPDPGDKRASPAGGDDEFGEFGDFADFEEAPGDAPGDALAEAPAGALAEAPAKAAVPEPAATGAPPLRVSSGSTSESLAAGVTALLPPSFTNAVPTGQDNLMNEELRQVEGLSQVLVTESSRTLLRELQYEDREPSEPLVWKRSNTRRQLLITLGVPINLDEILQEEAWRKRPELPPLELHVSPQQPAEQAPPAPAEAPEAPEPAAAEPAPAPQESAGDRRRRELGEKQPTVDMDRVKQLVAMPEDQLTLRSLPQLRDLARELQTLTEQTTELLAHHLQLRETYAADAEMYNTMIRDLVAGVGEKMAATGRKEKRSLLRRGGSGSSSRTPPTSGRGTPT